MELLLKRIAPRETYTIGKLYVDGVYFCDTLEDPVRVLTDKNKDGDFDDAGEGKIYGNTAIPAGRYRVTVDMSARFKREMIHILNVPGYTGVRMHSGVTAEHTHGCPLLGKNTVKGEVHGGKEFEKALILIIKSALEAHQDVFIEVI